MRIKVEVRGRSGELEVFDAGGARIHVERIRNLMGSSRLEYEFPNIPGPGEVRVKSGDLKVRVIEAEG